MTASSPAAGTWEVLATGSNQLLAVFQSPPDALIQLTVDGTVRSSSSSSRGRTAGHGDRRPVGTLLDVERFFRKVNSRMSIFPGVPSRRADKWAGSWRRRAPRAHRECPVQKQ